jgi:hypothetical protein
MKDAKHKSVKFGRKSKKYTLEGCTLLNKL